MSRRLTQEEFIERSKDIHSNKYDYSKTEYINNTTKVCIICPEHGEFWQRAGNHLQGIGCPKCSNNIKYTNDIFIEKARKIHGDKYDYSKVDYVNTRTKVCIICPEHGEFWQTPNAHLSGESCVKCHYMKISEKFSDNTNTFIEKARKIHGDIYDYSKVEYVNNMTKVCIICKEHGEFWQSPNKHLSGHGCRICANKKKTEKNRLTTDEFIEKAKKVHGEKYNYSSSDYIDYETPIKIICSEHGEFWQTPDSHLQGSGCPKCSHKLSKKEEELTKYITEIVGEDNVMTRVRKMLSVPQQEIDILVTNLGIGFEYNGIRWHSEEFGKDSNYHLNKSIDCEKNGIRLIHIFEDEWLEHKEIVKSKIKHILGGNNLQRLYARKCCIKEIKYTEAKHFLNNNHIQGTCKSTVYLGCFYNEELIGVMCFKRERNDGDCWELTRFATDITKHCIGVGGKLFKYFIRNYKPIKIKSFADRRWTTDKKDNLYTKLGFKLDKILKPDYKYVVGNKRVHKFNFRKQILLAKYKDSDITEDMTETIITQKLGFYKIWDCGLLKFVWER